MPVMRVVDSLPHEVIEEQHVRIPVSDGTELSARIWRPANAENEPVPAVLELIPYRNRDFTAPRDAVHHHYLAGHGYACLRVDLRGSGESDGVLTDEYTEQEFCDAEDVLAWAAKQPWSNGRSGMMGISWGGFNALQVAARRPPGLDAIVTVCSSDDRYADDVHYMSGCLLSDNLSWASHMFAYNSCPPDPAVVGERWQQMWLDRLEHSGLWVDEWLRHQRRDDYWKHGSVCENYRAVNAAVFAVSGWADGYSNAVFRMLQGLDCPRRGLIGPWSHKYPHLGEPGPAIGFLQEVVRWWDRWLKDADNGVTGEPTLQTWMQESVPPSTAYEERPGRWVEEPGWPSPNVDSVVHPLGRNRIAAPNEPHQDTKLTVLSPLSVGQFAGKWCSYNAPPDLPYDQREEDGGSIIFDTEVLDERVEILGAPVVRLRMAGTKRNGMVAVRLSDVDSGGRATRVTYGLLNLTHRNSHEQPEPLEPGETYEVEVTMNGVAQAFPSGHRIRLSLSSSYWPLAWPPPEPNELTIFTEGSELHLPVRGPGQAEDVEFEEAEGSPTVSTMTVRPGEQRWEVRRDLVDYASVLHVLNDSGTVRFDDIDMQVTKSTEEKYSWVGEDFTSPRGEVSWDIEFERDDWQARAVTRTVLTADPQCFYLHATVDAYLGAERIFAKNWQTTVRRDHV